jgi:hypothetical protein
MSSSEKKDYKVGYGKPPVETRFKPEPSGNRNGRPKKLFQFDPGAWAVDHGHTVFVISWVNPDEKPREGRCGVTSVLWSDSTSRRAEAICRAAGA